MQVHHAAPWLAPCFGQRSILEDLDSSRCGSQKKKKKSQQMQATKIL